MAIFDFLQKRSPTKGPSIKEIKSPVKPKDFSILDENCRCIQFSSPLTETDFKVLADYLRDKPNIALRVYGFYGHTPAPNLNFLKFFPFLENFQVDVWKIDNFEDLSYLGPSLKLLSLGQTKKKSISLKILEKFKNLENLYLEEHTKDIQSVTNLKNLTSLHFRSVTLPELSFLKPLQKLTHFSLRLGGTKNIKALPDIGKITILHIWQVRDLSDLTPIQQMVSLEDLFLQSLKRVKNLPEMENLVNLKKVHLETMKGLRNLSPLLKAKNLEELKILDAGHMDPSDFKILSEHKSLKKISVFLGSLKKNKTVQKILPLVKTYTGAD